jgi:hypothetical protein
VKILNVFIWLRIRSNGGLLREHSKFTSEQGIELLFE